MSKPLPIGFVDHNGVCYWHNPSNTPPPDGTMLYSEAPAVAVNEQLLEAAKKLESSASECSDDEVFVAMSIPLDVYLELKNAIKAADAAKGGAV